MPLIFLTNRPAYAPSLVLNGETLPTAYSAYGGLLAYSQNISGQATGGTPTYVFSLASVVGSYSWTVSTGGVINSNSPASINLRDDNTGAYRVDNAGNLRGTT